MSDPSTLAGSSPAPANNATPAVAPEPNGVPVETNAEAGPSTSTPNPPTTTLPSVPPQSADIVMNGESEPLRPNGESSGPDVTQMFAAKREEEMARRDRSLAEFLVMLDDYKPLVPEEITEYFLQRSGFECSDPRLKRLLSLSAQKFVADLSRDAYHFAKLRLNGATAGRGRPAGGADRNRVVLTMEDLSLALGEHGLNVKKPDYYI
ncbi:hypothetical protein CI109_105884 [Kwoniella shandongensis]|uniref:Uncharacterized protein n=1 Tax=Kwoniella shandongensis TaxID=1734106 RepID=A0A5M6BVC8_9TREE|nr:uncharacterized protein CI109_005679 [Kwoniella shandongensis]KAA5525932.1 hypothetical protein CI109_005679 [Kwoniella shandongensis]